MKIVEYARGYNTYGGWFLNIPPRHKKRLLKMAKDFNRGRPRFINGVINHVSWVEFIEVQQYKTRLFVNK